MKRGLVLAAVVWLAPYGVAAMAQPPAADAKNLPQQAVLIVVVAAAGADEYGPQFRDWAEKWRCAAEKASAEFTAIGLDDAAGKSDRERLQSWLADAAKPKRELVWVVLIGHGSIDGQVAKFNLRGADVSAEDLAEWLKPIESPMAVVNCASASALFINRLSAKDRVIVTATKSSVETNFARFGQYLAEAIADRDADLDKDGQTSLLEAYLAACRRVADFYDGQKRLATEHALLDDNGDGLGTPAAWFKGLRATQRAQAGAALDGVRASQIHLVPSDREARLPAAARKRRDELELAVAALRDEKEKLGEEEYYRRLEGLMRDLAKVYESAGDLAEPAPAAASAK